MVEGVEPRFLTLDELQTLHETGIAEHGGSYGVRDRAALETCVEQPKQSSEDQYLYDYPLEMAAVYMRQLLQGHPFVDGNKRAALTACAVFLRLNGWVLTADDEVAAGAVWRFAKTGSDRDAIASWLRGSARRMPSFELRSFLRSLHLDDLDEFAGSFDANTSAPERQQTREEAGSALPLVDELYAMATSTLQKYGPESAEGQTRATRYAGPALLLVAIYRHAENEGYEW